MVKINLNNNSFYNKKKLITNNLPFSLRENDIQTNLKSK